MDTPPTPIHLLGEVHRAECPQSAGQELLPRLPKVRADSSVGRQNDRAVTGISERAPCNRAVQRCHPGSIHFAAFGLECVQLRPKAELGGAQMFCMLPDPMLDVVSFEFERSSIGSTTQNEMDVRMASIEVGYGRPFQPSAKITLHPG
jgi:hypothetical protein